MKVGTSKLGKFALRLAASSGVALFCAGTALADSQPVQSDQPAQTIAGTTTLTETVTTATTTVVQDVKHVSETIVSDSHDGTPPAGHSGLTAAAGTDNHNALAASNMSDGQVSGTVLGDSVSTKDQGAAVARIAPLDVPTATQIAPMTQLPMLEQTVLHRAPLSVISLPNTPVQLAATDVATGHAPAAPTAPKANGFLSMLSTELAGIVVPKIIFGTASVLTSLPALPVAATAIILSLFLTLLASYVRLLRQSGYSHAARSDVSTFSFATPLLPDYGTQSIPIVVFSGVRDKTLKLSNVPNA